MNNGYTKIPNELMRNPMLSPTEKTVWGVIASTSDGYNPTIATYCAMVRCHFNTWRAVIRRLRGFGMVTVEHSGNRVRYIVVTEPSKWTLPNNNCEGNKICDPNKICEGKGNKNCEGNPNKICDPLKEQEKNNKKNIEEEDARARVIANLKTYDYWAESMCKNYGLTHEQLCAKVDEFVIDMACHNTKIEGLQNARGYFNSWLFNKNNRNNGTNQQSGQPSDPRAKLDADAVKAMAALAAESRRPKVVPF